MRKSLYILALFLLFAQDLYSQCAMCKAVAENDAAEEGATGINTGIIYIMVVPYIILFIVFRKHVFRFLKDLRKATGQGNS